MGNNLTSCSKDKTSGWSKHQSQQGNWQDESLSDSPSGEVQFNSTEDPNSVQGAVSFDEEEFQQVCLLSESGVGSTIEFIFENHPDVLNVLNHRRSSFLGNTKMDMTPLQLAATCGHIDVVKTLLKYPTIDANIADPTFCMTALHLAVVAGETPTVEVLCKDPNIKSDLKTIEGKTALHLAVENEYVNIVETILRLHPNEDFRTRDINGNTVFHLAAYRPNVRIMSLLANHASLVHMYHDKFRANGTGVSPGSTAECSEKPGRQILMALNHNKETVSCILTEAIRRIQDRRAESAERLNKQEQLAASASTTPEDKPETVVESGHTTEEPNEEVGNTTSQAVDPVGLDLDVHALLDKDDHTVDDKSNSRNGSPLLEEDVDIEVLLGCLGIINDAMQAYLSSTARQETLTSFGSHSNSSASQRKCSFDLDSQVSDDEGNDAGHGDSSKDAGLRAAYSWSPPFTPSLDQPEDYYTLRSTHSH